MATKAPPPLVFVHGYTASHLNECETGARRYFQLFGLFGLIVPQLSLPTTWEKDDSGKVRQGTDDLTAGEVIYDPVGPLSSVLGLRIIGNLVDYLREEYGTETTVHGRLDSVEERATYDPSQRLFFFTYDWRRDNNESSERLRNFLSDLAQTHELPQIVAHSNGGLLTYVRYDLSTCSKSSASSLKLELNSQPHKTLL